MKSVSGGTSVGIMGGLAETVLVLGGPVTGVLPEAIVRKVVFDAWTWALLGLHAKPCGLLNVAGYYDGLIAFLDRFEGYRGPAVEKWIRKGEA